MKEYMVNIPVYSYDELTKSCVILANCGVLVDNLLKMVLNLFNTGNVVPTREGLELYDLSNLRGTIPEYSLDKFKDLMKECFPDKEYNVEEVVREDDEDEEESEG